ncbi:hypothetical protein CLOL250_02242 [Clostridium sp. L2-50]|nr:hypothetical protein CLOL250_02242 [Clostridium sp. L2-50]
MEIQWTQSLFRRIRNYHLQLYDAYWQKKITAISSNCMLYHCSKKQLLSLSLFETHCQQ